MQAWMSEGLLRWGGAFQRLWTAVPPVITTLNLAGHSSAPLIEHLNLTRCYCHVLTNRQMPCYPPPPTTSSPPAYYGIFLFHRSVMHGRLRLWKWGERGEKIELEGYCLLNKSNNSTSLDGYITRGQLVSCHVLLDSHFAGTRFYISHVISDCYHAFPDLDSVFDTGACPRGISIPTLARRNHVYRYL